MTENRRSLVAAAFCALASWSALHAQVTPSVLEIDVQNRVQYFGDTGDPSRFATDVNSTTPSLPKNFSESVIISDIVAINGEPVAGTVVEHIRMLSLTKTPNPGEAIADVVRNNIQLLNFEILRADGTQVGTIMASGFGGGTAPPGSPAALTQGNNAIVGGVGAFLGIRGHVGIIARTVPTRQASITEDPATRRAKGGGRAQFIAQIIPLQTPQIVSTPGGPAVTHSSDFSLVTASKPAAAGEILSIFATGLGPATGVAAGQTFPSSPLAPVNSPVAVTVDGSPAQVLAAVGIPGTVDGYQVNFRMPADATTGNATVRLSAAWISGPAVNIAVQ